jgi:hypothetical protein
MGRVKKKKILRMEGGGVIREVVGRLGIYEGR